MAAVNGTTDILDPNNSSKNTLKLENVSFQLTKQCNCGLDMLRSIDRKTRYLDSHREAIPSEMAGIWSFPRFGTFNQGGTRWFCQSSRATAKKPKVLWDIRLSIHERDPTRWAQLHS